MVNRTLALILAGGRATRMGILCDSRPKPTLVYGGSHRVIDFTLSNCANSGIRKVAALVDHRRFEVARYLRKWNSTNRKLGRLAVLHPRHESYAGTADAVFQNIRYLEMKDIDTVLVLAGDHIYHMDYRPLLEFHRQSGADATVGVVRIDSSEAYRFGTVLSDKDGRVREFVEKSTKPASDLASMGIYAFNKKVLVDRVSQDAHDPNSAHDFGYSVMPDILRTGSLYAYEFCGYWRDVGTIEAYHESNMDLVGERPRFFFDPAWPILTHRKMIYRGTIDHDNISNSLIGPGCVIEGHVTDSVLSPGVHVGAFAQIRNSVIMANSHVGANSIVDSCILDERVRVGNQCCIGFGGSDVPGTPKITVLGSAVTVPDGTAIGRDCVVRPNAGPISFNSRAIPSGSLTASPR
jgi:glucose-1-phosphate adenylyltransferase